MFLTGALSAAGLNNTDPDQERDPPPDPTPITFPIHAVFERQSWTTSTPPPDLQALFAKIIKPSDISEQHADSLNITTIPSCSLDDLVPLAPNGDSYLPSFVSNITPETTSYADAAKADTALGRKRKEIEERLTELRIDNDLAFRTLTRTVTQGVKPPRLAYMRKFWEGLETMNAYWDCSLDQYFEKSELEYEGQKSPKRQRLDTQTCNADELNPAFGDASEDSEGVTGRNVSTGCVPVERRSRMRYKGRRTSTGRAMPDQFRVDTVKGFVEGVVYPFRSQIAPPRVMPIVQLGKLNLPVRQTAAVYRLPNDRIKGRQGWLEGPMLSVQVRPETDFESNGGEQLKEKSRLDLIREIGGLMQIAQERQRESKTESKPGEGKWWTTTPRWGGGPGGEVENEIGNSDIAAAAAEALDTTKEGDVKREKDGSRVRKKKTPAILWKELKCGRGYWDPRTDYTAIGKDPESDYDDVFLVSSLNHHISILKMTVHKAYLEYISTGTLPQPIPTDDEWSKPILRRSEWFDLFDMDQRLEAFRGLWGIMAYSTREITASADSEAQDAAMSGTK